MDLTPVKIRGKRGLGRALSKPSSNFSTPSTPGSSSSRSSPAKRPRTQSTTQDLTHKHKKKRRMSRFRLSPFEQLPNELLQAIFLLSENIELPGCSLFLAQSLSSPHIQLEYCLKFLYQTHRNLKPALQITRLLKSRFLDWPFLQKYMHSAHDLYKRGIGVDVANSEEYVSDVQITPQLIINHNIPSHWIQWLSFDNTNRGSPSPPVAIPRKLLHGPWTADKASFLYTLVNTGAEIDFENSSDGEIAVEGLYSAIRESCVRAVVALTDNTFFCYRRQDTLPPMQITTDMLKYAVISCGCNKAMVWHLLADGFYNLHVEKDHVQEESRTLDFMDPDLWAWADDDEMKGGSAGPFLKRLLIHHRRLADGVPDPDYPWQWSNSDEGESKAQMFERLKKEAPGVIDNKESF